MNPVVVWAIGMLTILAIAALTTWANDRWGQ